MKKKWLASIMVMLSTASAASTQDKLFLLTEQHEDSVLIFRSQESDCSYVGEYKNHSVTLSKEVCDNVERKIDESFKADEHTLKAGHVFNIEFKNK